MDDLDQRIIRLLAKNARMPVKEIAKEVSLTSPAVSSRIHKLEQDGIIPEYTVCGHNSATLRESLLDKAFEMAEKYVKATQQYYKPGIIGPFCLQTCVDKDLNFYIYDVAPRIGGGTNVHMSVGHPYGNTLWRTNMSTGRRLSMEVRKAIEQERLEEIIT